MAKKRKRMRVRKLRGFVPIAPDGKVCWDLAADTRDGCIGRIAIWNDPEDWRFVRCRVE